MAVLAEPGTPGQRFPQMAKGPEEMAEKEEKLGGGAELLREVKHLVDDASQSATLLAEIKELLIRAVAVLEEIRDRR